MVAHEFYPQQAIRILLDSQGRDLTTRVQAAAFDKQLQFVDKKQARALLQQLRQNIQQHIHTAWQPAEAQQQRLLEQAEQLLEQRMASAQQRLRELQQRNPAVRQSEVDALLARHQQLRAALAKPMLQLDSVRLVVNSPA